MFTTCIFFFNDTATTEIYTLSLHDALPISSSDGVPVNTCASLVYSAPATSSSRSLRARAVAASSSRNTTDRKSTRLNSSHANISYAVFCLKKKKSLRPHRTLLPIIQHTCHD